MGFLDTALRAIPRVNFSLGGTGGSRPSIYSQNPEYGGVDRQRLDYLEYERKAVDNAAMSTLVKACANYRANNAASTPWVLERVDGTEREDNHPVLDLLNRPSPFLDGRSFTIAMWQALDIKGNAYAIKVEGEMAGQFEVWPVPPHTMTPRTDDKGLLTHYEYKPKGQKFAYPREEVIHLRYPNPFGPPWEGMSPIAVAGTELWLDKQAGRHSVALLRNGARPGFIASLESMPDEERPSPDAVSALRDELEAKYTGDATGRPMFLPFPVKIHQTQYSPEEMHLIALHEFGEERVCGLYGLPAAVIQMRVGLQQTTTNASLEQWEKQAWHGSIIPSQEMWDDQLGHQLLPDFMSEAEMKVWKLTHDLSGVEVLQSDETAEVERALKKAGGPLVSVAEAREELGMATGPEHQYWWVPMSLTATAPDELLLESETMPNPFEVMQGGNEDNGDESEDDAVSATRQLPNMSRRATRLARSFDRDERRIRNQFARELLPHFDDLGRKAALAFRQQSEGIRQDLDPEDEALRNRIVALIGIGATERLLERLFQTHYSRVATMTVGSINGALGLGVNMPDPVHRNIIRMGGRRAGLLDLDATTRRAVYKALAEGRARGEGVDELARRIRHLVGSGRYTKAGPSYRARLIARTETKYAQNRSSMETYRAAGFEQIMLVDDQLGYGDEECSTRNGQIHPFGVADEIISQGDHPNGTLRAVPYVEAA